MLSFLPNLWKFLSALVMQYAFAHEKSLVWSLALCWVGLFGVQVVQGQSPKATIIILLRHAEKDSVGKDPDLSTIGKKRAEKLPTLFKDTKPDLFYATPFTRTQQTLAPWSNQTGKAIETYDPENLAAFAEEVRRQSGKTIVIAGHSNTTPALVNLLLHSEKYQPLNEQVYNRIWVVTIQNGVTTEKTMTY
jgi:broad specificity phosphatase PhoE